MRSIFFLWIFINGAYYFQPNKPIVPKFGGSQKCKICHGPQAGDQWGIWARSRHRQAFETLTGEKAVQIAAKMGISDPSRDDRCIKCHVTSVEKDRYEEGFSIREGVGCEGCHGAGSEYRNMASMLVKPVAIQKGLILPSKKDCNRCHTNEGNPTFREFNDSVAWDKIKHPLKKK